MDSRSRGHSARIRCRSPGPSPTRTSCGCSRSGCGATSRIRCSTSAARSFPTCRRSLQPATSGWAPRRTRMADEFSARSRCPTFATTRSTCRTRRRRARNRDAANFRFFCPDETNSNRLSAVFEVENRCFVGPRLDIDDHLAADGRVMEVLSEHLCEGWLEGYLLTGRHGLYVTYEAFAMVSASMTVQHAKWLEEALHLSWREPVASLNILLTSTCWRNDHNGFSHQGPGLIDVVLSKRGSVARIYLPPDANSLLAVADHCFRSRNYVNLIVIDKQPQLQWLSMDDAIDHARWGAATWDWAGTEEASDPSEEPDVILACAGDTPTLETIAAAWLLRGIAPEVDVGVVNVIDLMQLFHPELGSHGW